VKECKFCVFQIWQVGYGSRRIIGRIRYFKMSEVKSGLRIRINVDTYLLIENGSPGSGSGPEFRTVKITTKKREKSKISTWKEHQLSHDRLMVFTWAWESLIRILIEINTDLQHSVKVMFQLCRCESTAGCEGCGGSWEAESCILCRLLCWLTRGRHTTPISSVYHCF